MDVKVMKINSPVNYNGGDFNIVSVDDGSVTLRPLAKNLNDVVVKGSQVKYIKNGFYRSSKRLSRSR